MRFDPEGSGYDYETAKAAGMKPDETGHWSSREPRTGQILKGMNHESIAKTLDIEHKLGYNVYKNPRNGKWYSQPAGERVVDDVVGKVEHVLGGTKGMLKDIAYVESKYGQDSDTFTGYSNGIFQVDNVGLKNTQIKTKVMKRAHKKIKDSFNIEWSQITPDDLNNPLIAAIAARLYLLRKPEPIPTGKEAQAKYWKKYYNTKAGKGTVKKYLNRVK